MTENEHVPEPGVGGAAPDQSVPDQPVAKGPDVSAFDDIVPSIPALGSSDPLSAQPPTEGDALMCQRCGKRPAVSVITARWVQSYGAWFQRRQSGAPLCAVCGHQVLDEANYRALTRGMWGPAAAFTSFSTVRHNNEQRNVLPPVPDVVDGQPVRHPASKRPLVWFAGVGWLVWVGAIVTLAVLFINPNLGVKQSPIGSCWTSDSNSSAVACSNSAATERVIAHVTHGNDCETYPTFDGAFIVIDGQPGYWCLEKLHP